MLQRPSGAATMGQVIRGRLITNRPAAGVFFDSSVTGPGTGTSSDPYKTLQPLNALTGTGDLRGLKVNLKGGSIFAAPISLSGVSNLTIQAYGGGAQPIVSSYTAITVPWTVDPAMTNRWTTPQAGFGNGAFSCGIVMSPSADIRQGKYVWGRGFPADMNLLYETGATGLNWVWTRAWANVSGGLQYLVTDGTDPNTMTTFRPRTSAEVIALGLGQSNANFAISINNCANVTLSGVSFIGGRNNTLDVVSCSNFTMDTCSVYWGGSDDAGGTNARDLVSITGSSEAVRAVNTQILNCTIHSTMGTGSQTGTLGIGHGIEVSFLTGLTVSGCFIYDVALGGIELWNSTSDVTITRNRIIQPGLTMIIRAPVANTLHLNTLMTNNICMGMATYARPGASGGGSLTSVGIAASNAADTSKYISDFNVYNNTFVMDDTQAFARTYGASGLGPGNNIASFYNNMVLLRQVNAYSAFGYENAVNLATGTTGAASVTFTNNNAYQFGRDARNWNIGTGLVQSLAALQTAWGTIPGKTTNENAAISPAAAAVTITSYTNLATYNLTPGSGSVLIGAAATGSPVPLVDYNGVTRARNTIGAFD